MPKGRNIIPNPYEAISTPPPWERIHLIPDTSYAIDKRNWPDRPNYRLTSVGYELLTSDVIPSRVGIEIERIIAENTRLKGQLFLADETIADLRNKIARLRSGE